MNRTEQDRRRHSGPYKGICPLCKKRSYWIHLPHTEEFNRVSFKENFELAVTRYGNSFPFYACPECFHGVFAGEN